MVVGRGRRAVEGSKGPLGPLAVATGVCWVRLCTWWVVRTSASTLACNTGAPSSEVCVGAIVLAFYTQ